MAEQPHLEFAATLRDTLLGVTSADSVQVTATEVSPKGGAVRLTCADGTLMHLMGVRVEDPVSGNTSPADYLVPPPLRGTIRAVLESIGAWMVGPRAPGPMVDSAETFADAGFHKPAGVVVKMPNGLRLWLQITWFKE